MKVLVLVMVILLLQRVYARIITIPDNYESIQAGIDAGTHGDTILVNPGLYNEQIDIDSKSIVLASRFMISGDSTYIHQTIIDGNDNTYVLRLGGSTNPELSIIGFTIQNGADGIQPRSRFNLLHCVIQYCTDGVDYESGSGGLCQYNTFRYNSDDGIDLDDAVEIRIMNNQIIDNEDDGIEIRMQPYSGNALKIVIRDNIISGNGEDGIQFIGYPGSSSREFYISRNVINNNAMAGIGCMDDGETSENYEGASLKEPIFLTNNTIAGNTYGITGGDSLIAVNNIIVNCAATGMKNVDNYSKISFSLLWDNGLDFDNCNTVDSTLVLSDPEFSDSDYHLSQSSPAIDMGDPDLGLDPDSTRLDIGARHYPQAMKEFMLLQPPDRARVLTVRPELIWQKVVTAGRESINYTLICSDSLTFPDSGTVVIDNIVDSSFIFVDSLKDFRQYYWKILAKNPWSMTRFSQEVFRFTVNTDTTAPYFGAELPIVSFNEDDSISITDIYWYPYIHDTKTPDSLLFFQIENGSAVTVTTEDRVMTFSADTNWFGLDSLSFSVSDLGNNTTHGFIKVRVWPRNDPPLISDLPDTVRFFADSSTTIHTWDYVSDIETSDSLLAYECSSAGDLLTINFDDSTGFLYLSSPGRSGAEMLYLQVSDDSNDVAIDSIFVISIFREINPPEFTDTLPQLSFAEDDSLVVSRTFWYPYLGDKETADSLLNFSIQSGTKVHVSEHGNWSIFTADTNWFGLDSLKFTVRDLGEHSIFGQLIISVLPLNDPPVFQNLPDSLMFNDSAAYLIKLWEYIYDVETPDSELEYEITTTTDSVKITFTDSIGQLFIQPLATVSDAMVLIKITDDSGATAADSISINSRLVITDAGAELWQIPEKFILYQNYPNPFNPITTIRYGLPEQAVVTLDIYNILGQKVYTFDQGQKPAGYHNILWEATGFSSGIYIYHLRATGSIQSDQFKKMVLIK